MKIKATSAQYYGAWLGTQFWTWNYTIFIFGTELEAPSSEVSKQSHTINSPSLSPFYFYGLGRLHDRKFIILLLKLFTESFAMTFVQ
jgi:hypothetical protein